MLAASRSGQGKGVSQVKRCQEPIVSAKPGELALTAAMGKLLVTLNAILAAGPGAQARIARKWRIRNGTVAWS